MDATDKLLDRVPRKHRDQIIRATKCLLDASCRSNLHIQKLSGTHVLFYTHVGKYRIIFQMSSRVMIRDIRLRNEKTYRDI